MKYEKRKVIHESQGIADDVKLLSREISTKLFNSLTKNNTNYMNDGFIPFKIGEFHVDNLLIKYKIYFFKTENEKELILPTLNDLNCEYNSKFNEIKIISYFVGHIPDKTLFSSICHEVNHMYQYSKGFTKNEDFYNKVIQMTLNGKSQSERIIGRLLYMCFAHEQDSFANDFYGKLVSDFNDDNKLPFEFSEVYEKSEMKNMDALMNVMETLSDSEIENILTVFPMSLTKFYDYVYRRYERLEKKLNMVYKHFISEYSKKKVAYGEKLYTESFYKNLGFIMENKYNFIYS